MTWITAPVQIRLHLDPDSAQAWFAILRDVSFVALAAFILIHETIVDRSADPLRIGAALALLGVPPVLRSDQRRQRKNGIEGNGG